MVEDSGSRVFTARCTIAEMELRRRLRVGIELRAAARPTAGGIVVVLVGALQELFRRRPDLEFVVFCTVFNRDLLTADAPNVEAVTLPLDEYFSELGRAAHARGIDVLFRGAPTLENPDFPLDRQIFLIPDVQHEYHPEFFDSYARLSRRISFDTALGQAGAIMTISEFARQTIAARAGADRDVFVATPSLATEFVTARSDEATDEERATVPAAPFFFFPANLWPHKNHSGLLQAFRSFRERTGSDAEVVLTGSSAGWPELRAHHPDLPVRHLGYVSAPHLKLLYERALALAFFSRFEGFGIPLLEAFAVGTPVLCSNTTSLPEVAGDAALTCDPEDIEGISRLFERIEAEPELRAELVARGRHRLERFTWANAAEELDAAIQRVHARAKPPPPARPNDQRARFRSIRNRATVRRELAWRLLRNPRLLTLVLRVRALLARTGARDSRLRVTGFWPDNYLASRLEVVIEPRDRARELRITGMALVETALVVTSNGRQLGRFELRKGERVSPAVQVPRGAREIVTFSFSRHVVDEKGRAVAFLLEETNLFREEHLYALG
jgi:glycosyltransferase involved in cell wall biosynthesis